MNTPEAEVPPQRLWLPLEAALLLRGDEHGPHEIEYVPASALEAAWDTAIGIATAMAAGETYGTGRQKALNIAAALEAARDAALSAGKEQQ